MSFTVRSVVITPNDDRINHRGIELRLLPVLCLKWRFIGPAHAEVQRKAPGHFPVVLQVKTLAPPAGHPCGEILRIHGAADGSEQERGEGVSCIWRER